MRDRKSSSGVSDVTDAQERTVKGKLPRNIVMALGVIAAVLVGALGYYFQSVSEEQSDAKAEQDRAEQLRQRASSGDNGQSLEATIREQSARAREEAERQRALAEKRDSGNAPVMKAGDLIAPARPAAADAKMNEEDDIFTASIFKKGMRKSQISGGKMPGGLADLTDPAQMRALQQAAVARANTANGVPEPMEAPVSSDKQFLRDVGASNTLRTGFVGRLPKCTVSRGFVIPATFVGGLNSDKPGEFRATVSHDVYDTVTGQCKVIPAGSTLVGTYNADIAVGQERILAAFVRMQLPNGKTVPLMGMQGADPNGYSGISGDVNNHFWKIFSGALVIGLLEHAFKDNNTATTVGPGGLTTYGNAAGQIAAQTASTILSRNQSIRPTITTEPGQKMMVQVKHDIVLEAYRD
ncbi:Conjugative transfer protein TrbI (plasmid) [Cupriavidus necator H850]|uniref:TrbI/VirB10 family protein n=1 Tax=Cupriavidus necator TaxID=106590 RepID=UPI00129D5286|nr:TrbI/VirB10 family protein [Cupriavidus necator]KAI3602985.1 Conjugative transfer protein TrbI [Cupriavidus necator H850]